MSGKVVVYFIRTLTSKWQKTKKLPYGSENLASLIQAIPIAIVVIHKNLILTVPCLQHKLGVDPI